MQKTFITPKPVTLHVVIGRGLVEMTAADTDETIVQVVGEHSEDVVVEQRGSTIAVLAPRLRAGFFGGEPDVEVTVTVPTGSEASVKTGSADVTAVGSWGTSRIKTGSGAVRVDQADAPLVIESGSGDVTVDHAGQELRVKSGSGDVRVAEAAGATVVSAGSGNVGLRHVVGPLVVKTGSGDVRVATADGNVSFATGSGDTVVERINRGRFTAKGASGDVNIGIPSGVPVWTDISSVSGQVRSDLTGVGAPKDGQEYVELRAKIVSGDVILHQV